MCPVGSELLFGTSKFIFEVVGMHLAPGTRAICAAGTEDPLTRMFRTTFVVPWRMVMRLEELEDEDEEEED